MTPLPPRIVLIGFMGSGKSTVGRILARRLGYRFADTDDLVVHAAGRSIEEIFADEGEPAFRDREAAVLQELADRERIVVATGGGAPLQAQNAWFLEPPAAVFHLRVSLDAARERARGGAADGPASRRAPARPLMDRADNEVRALFEKRAPLYEARGTRVETDGRSPLEVALEIRSLLAGPRTSRGPAGSG
jgi:shikimate kinase